MAELHIVGEIVGAVGFEDRNLFCKVRAWPVAPTPRFVTSELRELQHARFHKPFHKAWAAHTRNKNSKKQKLDKAASTKKRKGSTSRR